MNAEPLTRREYEILTLMAAGVRDRNMGQALGISHRTVRFHIENAVRKLGAVNRVNAIARAYDAGVLQTEVTQ